MVTIKVTFCEPSKNGQSNHNSKAKIKTKTTFTKVCVQWLQNISCWDQIKSTLTISSRLPTRKPIISNLLKTKLLLSGTFAYTCHCFANFVREKTFETLATDQSASIGGKVAQMTHSCIWRWILHRSIFCVVAHRTLEERLIEGWLWDICFQEFQKYRFRAVTASPMPCRVFVFVQDFEPLPMESLSGKRNLTPMTHIYMTYDVYDTWHTYGS